MILEQQVRIEDKLYPVVISDEKQALLTAKSAGKAIVGYLHEGGERDLSPAMYLVESLDVLEEIPTGYIWMPKKPDVKEETPAGYTWMSPKTGMKDETSGTAKVMFASQPYLVLVVCRQFGLPWKIAETQRLCIREFTPADVNHVHQEPGDREADRIFYTPEKLNTYIQNQYGFYEYGIWAIVRKSDGVLLGKAGVDFFDLSAIPDSRIPGSEAMDRHPETEPLQLELGYHIFESYRNQGYAIEACQAILDYVKETWNCPLYAVVEGVNAPSTRLLKKLKFHFKEQRYNPEGQTQSLYVWNC